MNTVTLHFKADNQQLTALDGLYKLASNTVEYVKAIFTLGENWAGFDVVRAAWYTDFECISTVLDGNGECFVPWEVLSRPEGVTINLYGCDLEEESDGEAVLVDRLTTYPVKAILVDVDARVCGSETKPVTPSQFEQYIAIVQELVGTVRDITSCVLNPDYTLTINYSDDTSDTVGPIRGEQGEQGPTGPTGNGISKIEKISTAGLVDTYRITFTNGTHKDYTVTNGAKGDTGNGIESIYLTGTSGAVKTYTILFTNGNTFEYQVTDGEVTRAELESVLPTDTASGAIASFPDGSDLFDYLSCIVNIDPVQDLHGYDKPWVGGSGANKWDEQWEQGDLSGDAGQPQPSTTKIRSKNFCKCEADTTYYKKSTNGIYIFWYDSTYTYISHTNSVANTTATSPNNAAYFKIVVNDSSYNNDAAINYPSTVTTYSSWENICPITGWTGCNLVVSPTEDAQDGTTYPITWQTEAGTVYGGTVEIVNGVGRDKLAYLDLGDFNYIKGNRNNDNTGYIYRINIPSTPFNYGKVILSSALQVVTVTGAWESMKLGTIGKSGSDVLICFDATDAIAFKTAVTGVKILAEKLTPTPFATTPTEVSVLLGQNNVWANCGNIDEVKYKADVQLYIDKLLNP